MMKLLKEKIQRGQKDGTLNGVRLSLSVAKSKKYQRSSALSISCPKNPVRDTDNCLSNARHSQRDFNAYSKGGSHSVDSFAEKTATTCGCSSRSKKVRFDIVKIRQYERIASDNPCCSSGPPVGIGWMHGETHQINIDEFEQKRGNRRFYLDFVLSRSEREALLLKWNIGAKVIAASTRAANKTKLQRKQTVVNSRKYSKFEEAFESTSSRLKRAILSARETKKAKNGQLESVVSQTFTMDQMDQKPIEDTLCASVKNENDKPDILIREPEESMNDAFEVFEVSKGRRDDDEQVSVNDNLTLGATTIEDTYSCTPSMYEIEKFHRELELELFGEVNEVPSMIGQILELPISAENRSSATRSSRGSRDYVQNDVLNARDSDLKRVLIQSDEYPCDAFTETSRSGSTACDAMKNSQTSSTVIPAIPTRTTTHQFPSSQNCHHSTTFHHDALPAPGTGWEQHMNYDGFRREYNDSLCDPFPPSMANGMRHSMQCHRHEIHSKHSQHIRDSTEETDSIRKHSQCRQGSSLDSSHGTDSKRAISNGHIVTSSDFKDLPFCHRRLCDHYRSSSSRSFRSTSLHGPKVCHVPLSGHISASQLVNGTNGEHCFSSNATITITEENL